MTPRLFYGKYRGKVKDNADLAQRGRVEVVVPQVLGSKSVWALPSMPVAGPGVGFFALPPKGANVWVEFEGGDPEFPIWSGCFWDEGELPPALPASPSVATWKTKSISLVLKDLGEGAGFTLEVLPPAVAAPLKLSFTSAGIEIVNGKNSVKLTPTSVTINDGALEVV